MFKGLSRNEGADMKRVLPYAVAVSLLVAFLVTSARAQVLEQVPTDSLVVFHVKNLNSLNEKSAVLAKQWGLVEMTEKASNPVTAMFESMGIKEGLNKAGDAAVVVADGDLSGDQPPMIILIPVTDYKAFIGNFGEAKKDGGLDVFKMTFNGQADKDDTYAANWGKYAALTPVKELLAKKPAGFKPTGLVAKELEAKDAVFVVNFKVLAPKLTAALNENKDKAFEHVDQLLSKSEKGAKYKGLAKVALKQAMAMAEEFLTDVRGTSFSINLGKDGISTSLLTDFEDSTYLGKMFSAMKNNGEALLSGLPEGSYIFFGGGVNGSSEMTNKVIDDLLKPIETELAAGGEDMKPVLNFVQTMKKITSAQKSATLGLIAPTGALMASPLLQSVTISRGDSKVLAEGQVAAMNAQHEFMAILPNQPEQKTTITPNAKTIDGVQFTQFTTEVTGTDATAMQVKQMFSIMYGPSGATVFSGAVDDQKLLSVMGLDDAQTGAAIKAAKENKDVVSGTPAVTLVNSNLPKNRISEFYFDVGLLVTTGTNYAKMMGMPIPVSIKPNIAPIGVAVATEGTAMRIDSFVPSDLVEAMVATTLQFKMMGAGGKGKPGGI
jgi:hypothetical protein